MADIPGLIEGASDGAGLGHDFLKHIERTTIIVHILDIMPTDGSDPIENYKAIRNELQQHSKTLAKKQEIIVANKISSFGQRLFLYHADEGGVVYSSTVVSYSFNFKLNLPLFHCKDSVVPTHLGIFA